MRPRLLTENGLLEILRRQPLISAAEIAERLKVSQPTVSRGIAALGDRIVRIGQTRATRYALVRDVGRLGHCWPFYRIDARGRPSALGKISSLQNGHWFFSEDNPCPALTRGEFQQGVFPDLPWFLEDLRPQGFLGRAFVQAHAAALDVPADLSIWNSDHVLAALILHGDNLPGDLVLGDRALEQALEEISRPKSVISLEQRHRIFPELASSALRGQSVGSSAGGEQPKFTAVLENGDGNYRAAIVKFSEPQTTPSAVRWADLLQCEHIAGQVLATAGVPAANTHVLDSDGRRFLQSDRFDRTVVLGRRGYTSLRAIDAAFFARARAPWTEMADLLEGDRWLTQGDAEAMRVVGLFGDMIGNNDMHFGNIAFELRDSLPFGLVPIFDMLPMLYAPTSAGAIVERNFVPKAPIPRYHAAWSKASELAEMYWLRVANDKWISEGFRAIASGNHRVVTSLREKFN